MGHPVCGLSHSLPRAGIYSYNLLCPLSPFSRGTGFDSIAFLPFLLNCMCIFLNSYSYRTLASLQFIFSEDCSTYRSIPLCVFVGEVELHVFLLHHLFFPPKTSFFLEDFFICFILFIPFRHTLAFFKCLLHHLCKKFFYKVFFIFLI